MNTGYKQLTRSTHNRMIAGVCAGLGQYANVDPTLIRLVAILLLFFSGPAAVIGYLVVALIVPEEPAAQQQS